jgi:hypothetical protein
MMTKRVVPFPIGTQQYLEETYGFPPYSDRHLKLLISQNKYPKPIKISDRRQVSLIGDLDAYAEKKLAPTESSVVPADTDHPMRPGRMRGGV